MATQTVTISSSGNNTYSSNTTIVAASATAQYTVTAFTLDWNSNAAYIESNGTNQFTIKLTIGNVTIDVGTYSRSNATGSTAYGARPTISWSGSIRGQAGQAIKYVQAQVDSNKRAGICNAFKVTVTYTSATKPTVSAGEVITKTQMDNLKTWLGKGTSVTQNDVITATVGNSYRSSTTTAGTTILDDAWFNG